MSVTEIPNPITLGQTDQPLDARARIAGLDQVGSIDNPFIGMMFYSIAERKTYKVTKLKARQVGAMTVPNRAIDTYEEVPDAAAIKAINDQLDSLDEEMALTAKSVNGITPDETGNIQLETGGGGGASALSDLSDVSDVSGAAGGQALVYDAESATWKPGTVSVSAGWLTSVTAAAGINTAAGSWYICREQCTVRLPAGQDNGAKIKVTISKTGSRVVPSDNITINYDSEAVFDITATAVFVYDAEKGNWYILDLVEYKPVAEPARPDPLAVDHFTIRALTAGSYSSHSWEAGHEWATLTRNTISGVEGYVWLLYELYLYVKWVNGYYYFNDRKLVWSEKTNSGKVVFDQFNVEIIPVYQEGT